MIKATEIKCEHCGNTDPEQFETVEGGYSAPERMGGGGGVVLVGARCMRCGTVEKLDGEVIPPAHTGHARIPRE